MRKQGACLRKCHNVKQLKENHVSIQLTITSVFAVSLFVELAIPNILPVQRKRSAMREFNAKKITLAPSYQILVSFSQLCQKRKRSVMREFNANEDN